MCMYTCMYVGMYVFSNISSLLNTPWTIAADMCACIHDMYMYNLMHAGMYVYVYLCRYLRILKHQPASQYATDNHCRCVCVYI